MNAMVPLIWILLNNLLSRQATEVRIDCVVAGARRTGEIYLLKPCRFAVDGFCSMQDADQLLVRYTDLPKPLWNTPSGKFIPQNTHCLDLYADEQYTIKNVNGIPTLVDIV